MSNEERRIRETRCAQLSGAESTAARKAAIASSAKPVVRNEQLDWLRGLLALSIMIYHLTTWEFSQPSASTLLGRLGVYGVSMFFVLSGLSIAIAYNRHLVDTASSVRFLVRRIFRIWPLFWLTVLTVTAMDYGAGTPVRWKLLVANLTTAFGFISPTSYMTTGAWSIGNEMVYYALTPILLLTFRRSRTAGNLLVFATIAVGIFFSTALLSPVDSLSRQWATYVNPFNNLFLFCSGVALFFLPNPGRKLISPFVLLLACAAVLLYWPADGDAINVVTGTNRLVFSLASVGLVLAFYHMRITVPFYVTWPLVQLGLATYGIYLLHSVIWRALRLVVDHMRWSLHGWPVLIGVGIATVLVANVLFHTIESYFIQLGKMLTTATRGAALNRPLISPDSSSRDPGLSGQLSSDR